MMFSNVWKPVRFVAPLCCIGLWACLAPPVESPVTTVTQETDVRVAQNIKNKVDILFMIDNSPSMSPKQAALQTDFPQLIKVLDDFGMTNPAWYHIGVVTSDMGAGQFNLGSTGTGCHPGGDGAKLQAIGKGVTAPMMCGALGHGYNFIDYNQLNNHTMDNLPTGQDLQSTFTCMASVGDVGCGFEAQLESVYQALHNTTIAENANFLREDAILVVVWVTDEDDCSADPNTDLFDPTLVAKYGSLLSYRCTNYSIACGTPPALVPYASSNGPLSDCVPATAMNGNKLTEVSKYINFFSQPAAMGGVKVDPNDVVLVSITAPASPVNILVANPSENPPGPYQPCAAGATVDGRNCAVVLDHSCISATNTAFFGDPAVRISAVVNAAFSSSHKQITSICDESYTSALQGLGQIIVSTLGAGCLSSPLPDPTMPDCVVEDVTDNTDGTESTSEISWCGTSGIAPPCWRLSTPKKSDGSPACPNVALPNTAPQQYGVEICRESTCDPTAGSALVKPNTTARVACATIAHSGS